MGIVTCDTLPVHSRVQPISSRYHFVGNGEAIEAEKLRKRSDRKLNGGLEVNDLYRLPRMMSSAPWPAATLAFRHLYLLER